ncbi:hypothetical protein D3C84_726480 [compost metagenome]
MRISASISTTRCPLCAMTAARLEETKVLPTCGLGPEIMMRLLVESSPAKCRQVRKLRIDSMDRSVGLRRASR